MMLYELQRECVGRCARHAAWHKWPEPRALAALRYCGGANEYSREHPPSTWDHRVISGSWIASWLSIWIDDIVAESANLHSGGEIVELRLGKAQTRKEKDNRQ